MMRNVHAEIRKLNGSLALLLLLVAPAFPGVLALLSLFSAEHAPRWGSIFSDFVLPIWAFFLLPMTVTAFTTLVAQIEYKGRAWDHLLALPIARWQIFGAKAIVVLGAAMAMTTLSVLFTLFGAWLGGGLTGLMPIGDVPWRHIAQSASMIAASAAWFTLLQLWVALRFGSFVVPIAFGIGGTLVAIAISMTRIDNAAWFPWALPIRTLIHPDPMPYLLIGVIGAVITLIAMVVELSARSLR